MNILSNIIGVLSFGDTDSRFSAFCRKAYFSVAYNTTFPVNLMLALGSMSPYIAYMVVRRQIEIHTLVPAVVVTIVSAYFYNLIYIVNDIFDRKKDEKLKIPKQTARHVLGENYLWGLGLGYLIVTAGMAWVWPNLLWPLIVYGIALMGISVVHSHAKKWKALTVFVERWAKFCAPFWLLHLATGATSVLAMFLGALVVYPLGFTLDYAYKGYLKDRLKLSYNWRWWLYGAYWVIVAGALWRLNLGWTSVATLMIFAIYIVFYFTGVAATYILANILPYSFLDGRYSPGVVTEKRRLLTYGLIQLAILVLGGIYAAIA